MTIAMIGQKGLPAIYGGVERHVHELSLRLVQRGFSVTVYSRPWYSNHTKPFIDGIHVKLLPTIQTKHLDTIIHALFSTIHAIWNSYDVIHYHGVGPSLVSWIPRLVSPRARVITTFHSIDRKNEKWGLVARLFLKLGEWTATTFAHHTIVVTPMIQQYVRDVYNKKTAYIPSGVPLYEKIASTDSLTQWSVRPGEYFLMVARLIPLKGTHYLIQAFKELVKEMPEAIGNKKLVIVGNGSYSEEYVKELHRLGSNDPRIIFTGFLSGTPLAELMSHAYAMVHPSDYEGLPLTVLEGMSYGLPLLVSDIMEHRNLIMNPEYRFIQGNTGSLKRHLLHLLTLSDEERNQLGQENRQLIETSFQWDNSCEQIIELYKTEQPLIAHTAIAEVN